VLTYQVRKRVFRVEDPASLSFPCDAVISFKMQPLQPFGMAAGGGRTTVQNKPATLNFDLNSGMYGITSSDPLKPLEVMIDTPDLQVRLEGNVLTISTHAPTMDYIAELASSFYYAFPSILNIEFADPPFVERVYGTLGGTAFRWELEHAQFPFEITDQDMQEHKFLDSWQRIPLVADPCNRRILGALAYLHTACRLSTCGCAPWEFMPEIILNLAKTLEVLFPGPEGKTIDYARKGLRSIGYTTATIERDFVPILALRNAVDVGHPFLAVLKREQLETIYGYTETAEQHFKDLLRKVIGDLGGGKLTLQQPGDLLPDQDVINVIERIANQRAASTPA
jgi:hypothetical protein